MQPKPDRLPLTEKASEQLLGIVPPNRPRPGQMIRPMSKREKTKVSPLTFPIQGIDTLTGALAVIFEGLQALTVCVGGGLPSSLWFMLNRVM